MMNKLLLSCRTATALMEKKHREKISLLENIQLAMHVTLCSACRNYQKQSALLEEFLRKNRLPPEVKDIEKQTEALQQKILVELENKKK